MVTKPWIKSKEAKDRRRIRVKIISLKHSEGYAQKDGVSYQSWAGRANMESKRCVNQLRRLQYD